MATKAFYPTVTKTPHTYRSAAGDTVTVELPLVTLPPGTLLFRGFQLPPEKLDPSAQVLSFYKDFLGESKDNKSVCLTPTHNTFFYPFPYVAFGVHGVGQRFNAMAAYVTTRPLTVVSTISPSDWVRGSGHAYYGGAPWARCTEFMQYKCRELAPYEMSALGYDNCLEPNYAKASGVRGWMAIADLDSLEPGKFRKEGRGAKDAPMTQFLKRFHDSGPRNAEVVRELLTWTYTDKHKHAGFPEIALYPYAEHPGPRLIRKKLGSEYFAQQRLASLASENNLNYLPLAIFTPDRFVDLVNGPFNTDVLKVSSTHFGATDFNQMKVCTNLRGWMEQGFTEGLELPFYGPGKISFDSRTGFLVLPQMIPQNLALPIPRAIHAAEVAEEAKKKVKKVLDAFVPYQRLCLPYDTKKQEERVMRYNMFFRTYLEQFYMKKYPAELTGLRRAFIFGRPVVLKQLSEKIEIPLGRDVLAASGKAAGLYQQETGIEPKAKRNAGAAAAAAGALAPIVAPAGEPLTPPYGAVTPPYGAVTPPYGGPVTPPYGAATPVAYPEQPVFGAVAAEGEGEGEGGFSPRTPEFGEGEAAAAGGEGPRTPPGGLRRLRGGRRQTRSRGGAKRAQTRKAHKGDFASRIAKTFSQIWHIHGRANSKA